MQKKHNQVDIKLLESEILNGDIKSISKALTLIESNLPQYHNLGIDLVNRLTKHKKSSLRIGITGVPGVGKSTFIEALGEHLLVQNHKIGILAIDPSSQKTKGSILGDKTRMENLSQNTNVFIRPTPSSGTLGGVAKATRESITILEAAGYDIILIETVGVGQSEISVGAMVDFFLLLMIPGAGDELQGIKRGIMEMADGIVINKAEGENEKKAMLAKNQLENALHLFPLPESSQATRVMLCSALHKKAIDKVWKGIQVHLNKNKKSNYFEHRRANQAVFWFKEAVKQELENSFFQNEFVKANWQNFEEDVANQKLSPFSAAKQIIAKQNQPPK